jgi:rhodanese-related sulfurtransferase
MNATISENVLVAPIAPADAARRLAAGELYVVDVRTEVEHAAVHAQGVAHVPLDQFDPAAVIRQANGRPIACICKSGARGAKAAQRLADAGAPKVLNVAGGTTAWEHAGLPVERSSKVIPLERQVFIGAGTLVLTGVALAWLVHPYWIGLSAFVGAGLMFSGLTGFCGMAIVLARMPWNRNLINKACGACAT